MKTIPKSIEQNYVHLGRILEIILLGIWVLFQIRQGNKLYVIVLILLFAALSIFRVKDFTPIAAVVLVIVLFKTPAVEGWILLRDSNLRTFQSFKPSISRLFTPNSGRDVLPPDIQQLVLILEKNKIVAYRIPSSFTFQTHIELTEAAWPIRQESTSPYLLYRIGEDVNLTGCTKMDQTNDVALAYCP